MDWEKNTPTENTMNFFEAYLTAPIILAFYVPYKIWKKTKIARTSEMDLQTGMRELNLAELLAEERAEQAAWPRWKKWYKFLC